MHFTLVSLRAHASERDRDLSICQLNGEDMMRVYLAGAVFITIALAGLRVSSSDQFRAFASG